MHPELTKYYNRTKQANSELQHKRQTECVARVPSFARISAAKSTLLLEMSKHKISPSEARRRLSQLQQEQEILLLQNGFAKNYLDSIFSCPYCEDTGYAGDPVRRPCSCHMLLLQQYLADGARVNRDETFENFDETVYPTEQQRKTACVAKKRCERYADALPEATPPNLLILGRAGLGKSFLGNAIASRALSNGVFSLRTAAYRFISDIMDGISERKSRLSVYTDVDLLVLDDLGAETLIPSITAESIFHVLNERISGKKPTVVITNLSLAELSERYGERIASRLYDGVLFDKFQLTGDNLRIVRN